MDFVKLEDWLKQREIYDKIKQLNFFRNFFAWKTVKLWQKCYLGTKRKFAQEKLKQKLYFNYSDLKQTVNVVYSQISQMEQLLFIEIEQYKQEDVAKDINKFMYFQSTQIQAI